MREFVLDRRRWTDRETGGRLFLLDDPIVKRGWNILEDKDRGLEQGMAVEELLRLKVPKETAIPYGTYLITIDLSNRFKKLMPHILNVPAYDGIRVHRGVKPEHTEGCPLITDGVDAYDEFYGVLLWALGDADPCKFTVTKNFQRALDGTAAAIAGAVGPTPLSGT